MPLRRTTVYGPLAQLVEQQTLNLRVEGSIPSRLRNRLRAQAVDCTGVDEYNAVSLMNVPAQTDVTP